MALASDPKSSIVLESAICALTRWWPECKTNSERSVRVLHRQRAGLRTAHLTSAVRQLDTESDLLVTFCQCVRGLPRFF